MPPFKLDDRLVVGIASSALFDLTDSDQVFRTQGEAAYRRYQEEHLNDTLEPGEAYPFIRRLLSLNDLADAPDDPLVEVIVLSRNDPDTGLRVMKSIEAHCLPITRAVFMQGRSPHKFMPAFNMSLFLSASARDVKEAVSAGLPAGQVLQSPAVEEDESGDLRIAFDFDGVLADDASEGVMQEGGLPAFHAHEVANLTTPHTPGPLEPFLAAINRIQDREEARRLEDPEYRARVHVAIVTARNAPSHERAVASLKRWGVRVNDAFFLGGVEKARVLGILKPHIFFDDQKGHLEGAAKVAPSVHVPFGVINEA
ncbi:5'-nucleotidase [Actinotalea sp. AC32]|nr:5'-nucleotidase [Actinotalea sp. AC32]